MIQHYQIPNTVVIAEKTNEASQQGTDCAAFMTDFKRKVLAGPALFKPLFLLHSSLFHSLGIIQKEKR